MFPLSLFIGFYRPAIFWSRSRSKLKVKDTEMPRVVRFSSRTPTFLLCKVRVTDILRHPGSDAYHVMDGTLQFVVLQVFIILTVCQLQVLAGPRTAHFLVHLRRYDTASVGQQCT